MGVKGSTRNGRHDPKCPSARRLRMVQEDTSASSEGATYAWMAAVVSSRVLKMKVNKEKIRFFLQFFFDNGENASQVAEIANGVYGADTVTANYLQFWFRRFRSSIFDVKDAPRTGRLLVENVYKIAEIIKLTGMLVVVASPGAKDPPSNIFKQFAQSCFQKEARSIDQKRPELVNRSGVVFHQGNALPHTSIVTHQELWELG
ncbi:histone-lysine N-methyltransferase SETMAR [Trichonephila clavipes]|nr:histone-lysine N-methyltransferase SETMAR [Trichonephila clavipes]